MEYTASSSNCHKPLSIVDQEWELIDPHPDIHALFMEFDSKFFYGKLQCVEVKWSPRMTLCAGVCSYEGRSGLCSVRLSSPLLKYRPRRDLVETLLHEMIHAFLFVTYNNKDHNDHGPEFLEHMYRINKETGAKITVYHNFHDEVDFYKQHWWKCDGPCKDKRPYFGLVKRAMNRAPGPSDDWWTQHQVTCGGKFIKIKEPENYKSKTAKRKSSDSENDKVSDIRTFFKSKTTQNLPSSSDTAVFPSNKFIPFQGKGYKLNSSTENPPLLWSSLNNRDFKIENLFDSSSKVSGSHSNNKKVKVPVLSVSNATNKEKSSERSNNLIQSVMDDFIFPNKTESCASVFQNHDKEAECPVCFLPFKLDIINSHLDMCISI